MAGSGNDGDDGAQSESFKRGEEFRQKVTASLGETVDLDSSDSLITSGIRLSDIPSSGESCKHFLFRPISALVQGMFVRMVVQKEVKLHLLYKGSPLVPRCGELCLLLFIVFV